MIESTLGSLFYIGLGPKHSARRPIQDSLYTSDAVGLKLRQHEAPSRVQDPGVRSDDPLAIGCFRLVVISGLPLTLKLLVSNEASSRTTSPSTRYIKLTQGGANPSP